MSIVLVLSDIHGFQHVGLKLLSWVKVSHVVGVNVGQMLNLNILTPMGTSLCDSAMSEPLSIKMCPVSDMYVCLRKNSHTKVIFHPFAQKIQRMNI